MYLVQLYRQRLLLDMADDAPAVSPQNMAHDTPAVSPRTQTDDLTFSKDPLAEEPPKSKDLWLLRYLAGQTLIRLGS